MNTSNQFRLPRPSASFDQLSNWLKIDLPITQQRKWNFVWFPLSVELEPVTTLMFPPIQGTSVRDFIDRHSRSDLPIELLFQMASDLSVLLYEIYLTPRPNQAGTWRFVHMDLTPDTIFLTSNGEIKILDTGIVRSEKSLDKAYRFGDPQYSNPELAADLQMNHPSNLFSVGLILWEMVGGQKYFQTSDRAEVTSALKSFSTKDLKELRPDLPDLALEIVHKMLAPDPSLRFANGNEFSKKVQTFFESRPMKLKSEALKRFFRGEEVLGHNAKPVLVAPTPKTKSMALDREVKSAVGATPLPVVKPASQAVPTTQTQMARRLPINQVSEQISSESQPAMGTALKSVPQPQAVDQAISSLAVAPPQTKSSLSFWQSLWKSILSFFGRT